MRECFVSFLGGRTRIKDVDLVTLLKVLRGESIS